MIKRILFSVLLVMTIELVTFQYRLPPNPKVAVPKFPVAKLLYWDTNSRILFEGESYSSLMGSCTVGQSAVAISSSLVAGGVVMSASTESNPSGARFWTCVVGNTSK